MPPAMKPSTAEGFRIAVVVVVVIGTWGLVVPVETSVADVDDM